MPPNAKPNEKVTAKQNDDPSISERSPPSEKSKSTSIKSDNSEKTGNSEKAGNSEKSGQKSLKNVANEIIAGNIMAKSEEQEVEPTPEPVVEPDLPYVPPKPCFARLKYGDEENAMLNLRCRKGILLKSLRNKLRLYRGEDKLDFVSMDGQLIYLNNYGFHTECTQIFLEGVHTYLPVLIYKDDDGEIASVQWLIDDVEEIYPETVEALNNFIARAQEAALLEKERLARELEDETMKRELADKIEKMADAKKKKQEQASDGKKEPDPKDKKKKST